MCKNILFQVALFYPSKSDLCSEVLENKLFEGTSNFFLLKNGLKWLKKLCPCFLSADLSTCGGIMKAILLLATEQQSGANRKPTTAFPVEKFQ